MDSFFSSSLSLLDGRPSFKGLNDLLNIFPSFPFEVGLLPSEDLRSGCFIFVVDDGVVCTLVVRFSPSEDSRFGEEFWVRLKLTFFESAEEKPFRIVNALPSSNYLLFIRIFAHLHHGSVHSSEDRSLRCGSGCGQVGSAIVVHQIERARERLVLLLRNS